MASRSLLRLTSRLPSRNWFPRSSIPVFQHNLWYSSNVSSGPSLEVDADDGIFDDEDLLQVDNPMVRLSAARISTLDPSRLGKHDFVDISSLKNTTMHYSGALDDYNSPRNRLEFGREPFPSNSSGFFYYHIPPRTTPLAGQVRLRLTSSDDPSTFATGSDLPGQTGRPWHIPLFSLAHVKHYTLFRHLLLKDSLVSQEIMDLAETFYMASVGSVRLVHSFGQPFVFKLDSASLVFRVIGPTTVELCPPARGPYIRVVNQKFRKRLFSGTVMCCFERYTLPAHFDRPDARVVAVRLLRVLEPIVQKSDVSLQKLPMNLVPREGELLNCIGRRAKVEPWIFDVDMSPPRSLGHGLRLLFENELLP